MGDAEPAPVVAQGVAGIFGDGSDAVEGEEFAEIGGKAGDGFCRSELGKFEGDGVVENRDARAGDGVEQLGKNGGGVGREDLGDEEAERGVERGAWSVERRRAGGAEEAVGEAAKLGGERPRRAAFFGGGGGETLRFPRLKGAPGAGVGVVGDGAGVGAEGSVEGARDALDAGARAGVARVGEVDENRGGHGGAQGSVSVSRRS